MTDEELVRELREFAAQIEQVPDKLQENAPPGMLVSGAVRFVYTIIASRMRMAAARLDELRERTVSPRRPRRSVSS